MNIPFAPRHLQTKYQAPGALMLLQCLLVIAVVCLLSSVLWVSQANAQNKPVLAQFIEKVPAASLVEGADAYGPVQKDVPVAPVLKNGEQIGGLLLPLILLAPPAIPANRSM